jgi:hypothetical protein
MQDLLERALFFCIGKDYASKRGTIQPSSWKKDGLAKFGPESLPRLGIPVRQFARRLIGVEQPSANLLVQAAGETRFSGGDSACDPDDKAGFRHFAGGRF